LRNVEGCVVQGHRPFFGEFPDESGLPIDGSGWKRFLPAVVRNHLKAGSVWSGQVSRGDIGLERLLIDAGHFGPWRGCRRSGLVI
jgi:hypothetical protein